MTVTNPCFISGKTDARAASGPGGYREMPPSGLPTWLGLTVHDGEQTFCHWSIT